MSKKMTAEEHQAFLSEIHVAIISVPKQGRGPFTVPVWYAYTSDGYFYFWTGGDSRKAQKITHNCAGLIA